MEGLIKINKIGKDWRKDNFDISKGKKNTNGNLALLCAVLEQYFMWRTNIAAISFRYYRCCYCYMIELSTLYIALV